MREELKTEFFALLRSGLTGEPLPADCRGETDAALDLAVRHDVGPIAASAALRAGLCAPGSERERRCRALLYSAVSRTARIEHEQSESARALSDAGIAHVLLKGGVVRALYPESWMRTSCDIDLLVPEPKLDAAIDVLRRALGYRRTGRREYHDVGLLAPSSVHLELHFNILENTPALDRVLGRVWDYTVPTGEGSALRETPEFYLFHHLAHMAYHLRTGGCGVRPFLDLWLLERRGGYDAAALDALLAESGLTQFTACARTLARHWLEGAECGALEARTEEFVLAGGVYGVWDQKVAVEQERAGGRLGYLRGRLWMPYDGLIHIFPWLRGRRWLTPLAQVLRWTKLFRRGVLRRVRGEVALNRRLDPEKRRTASELMRDLGIL